jgi:Leucine-rich repeat (LRR) protein
MFIPPADDSEALVIAETMSNLSHLDIKGNMLTNIGLLAILDGCSLLDLNESLKKRCLDQIKDVRLPNMDASNRYYYDDNNYSHFDYQDLYDEYLFGYD